MWLGIFIFSFALIGLIALFILKGVEMRGRKVSALLLLRCRCDAFVAEKAGRIERFLNHDAREIIAQQALWCRTRCVEAEVAFLKASHIVIARLHERLLRRKAKLSNNNGAVSAHLKSMLEYKEEAATKK